MRIWMALGALLALAQEADDPRFKYWSGCKVGSWVKLKAEVDAGGQKMEMEQVQKLLEVSDSLIKLETTEKMSMAGRDIPTKSRTQEIKAKVQENDIKIDGEGDEELEVAGKKLKCHWYDMSFKTGAAKNKVKAWLTTDIPGGIAKMEMKPPAGPRIIEFRAVEWEKK